MKRVFLAGIIQGSHNDKSIHSQDYREKIITAILSAFPEAEVYNPFDGHEKSIDYDDTKGKETFFQAIEEIKQCDLMVAYLPQASLGTAIEIWECYKLGIPVWTISGMMTNWVVRFCSEKIFDDIDSFAGHLESLGVTSMKEN
jgi:nucleoside 2-deoxyribosyltransferase